MAAQKLEDVMRQADELSPDEMLALAGYLLDRARRGFSAAAPLRRWHDLRGMAPYPLAGADAQAYVERVAARIGREPGRAVAVGLSAMERRLAGVARLFLDTAPLIYYVEAHRRYQKLVGTIMERVDGGAITAVTSPITLAECLVLPYRRGLAELADAFR